MRLVSGLAGVVVLLCAVSAPDVRASWLPRGVVPTAARMSDVLAANARALGTGDVRFAQRRERWTYTTATRTIAVTVAVRDDDFRTSLELDGLTYMAGRLGGVRWRADGNGIAHGVEADLQSDAADRAPQALFRLDFASCRLAGEAHMPAPAWVLETQRSGEKDAFLYVDEATGSIVREVMRDGKGVVTTDFDRFERYDAGVRARHWRVADGNPTDTIDATVDAIEPGPIGAADVALPDRRVFATADPMVRSVDLPASFANDQIDLEVRVNGERRTFVLDTGTTSITIDPALGHRYGDAPLEHAVLPRLAIGPLQLDRVSVLTVPLEPLGFSRFGGLLGLDFFYGHVVEIDYRHARVRVLSSADAQAVFDDPKTTVIDANVDQGLPLIRAGFATASGDTFAIDSGSSRLYVMRPFIERFAAEIAAHWTPAGAPFVENYLEGGIEIQPYRAANFQFANARAKNVNVGGQIPTKNTDDLAIPFDGIIGTDILRNFDLFFDYDASRLGVRS